MIPFDLEQFDEAGKEGETASRVEGVGKAFLVRAGLDREGAALLISKFYMRYNVNLVSRTGPWLMVCRKDTASRYPDFLSWATTTVGSTVDPFPVRPCMGSLDPLLTNYNTGDRTTSCSVRGHQAWLRRTGANMQGTASPSRIRVGKQPESHEQHGHPAASHEADRPGRHTFASWKDTPTPCKRCVQRRPIAPVGLTQALLYL